MTAKGSALLHERQRALRKAVKAELAAFDAVETALDLARSSCVSARSMISGTVTGIPSGALKPAPRMKTPPFSVLVQ
jgi:hypothetical protein